MGEPPLSIFSLFINPAFSSADTISILFSLAAIAFLIFCSACFSGSENALFSLSAAQLENLQETPGSKSEAINFLTRNPKKLLATILIANTFVNIAIVMVTSNMFHTLFDFETYPWLGILLELVLVTFMLVLFGEVIPKIYSFKHNEKVAALLAVPLQRTYMVLKPLVMILEQSTSIIDKRITRKGHIFSADELTHAIDITSEKDTPKQEKSILKSVVNFGNTNVKQIMRQRPDIVGADVNLNFEQLMLHIVDSGYSRIPVFDSNLDQIKGVLFTKDLLTHMDESANFDWRKLLRPAFFVPESKKIDDLLKEFQTKRMHLAIVVDEFGGTSGLVSMEDIVEEVFGEIQDEFDEDEHVFTRINKNTFVFEAKMLINDVCRYMEVDASEFDEVRNEAETLGGLLLELNRDLPKLGQEIRFNKFCFKIESVDARKIKRVKVSIEPNKS
jgi:putative hemolysin